MTSILIAEENQAVEMISDSRGGDTLKLQNKPPWAAAHQRIMKILSSAQRDMQPFVVSPSALLRTGSSNHERRLDCPSTGSGGTESTYFRSKIKGDLCCKN
jgi:hypothetical protein